MEINLLNTLLIEQPQLRASAMHVLSVLETKKNSHPYWMREYKFFKKHWTLMQECLNNMLFKLELDGGFTEEKQSVPQEKDFESVLIRERHALKSSALRVRRALNDLFGPQNTWVIREQQVFMHIWSVLDGSLASMIKQNIPKEEDMHFCCELKCLLHHNTQVDGLACEKCQSYGTCHCDCVMHMKYMHDTHCCSLWCTKPQLGICLLCPGACLCKCVTHQRDLLQRADIETMRMNGQVIEVVKYEGNETHCCEKKCFPIPDRLVRGLTCKRCEAVNFCKCECITWKEMQNKYGVYEPLKKPKEGWHTANEKDLEPWQKDKYFEERLKDNYYRKA